MSHRRLFCLSALAFLVLAPSAFSQGKGGKAQPKWIWLGDKAEKDQTVFFRKNFTLTSPVKAARIFGACDNQMHVSINGKEVLSSDSWENPVSADVTSLLKVAVPGGFPDPNLITVKAHNSDGPAGLVLRLVIETADKDTTTIVTDNTWLVSATDDGFKDPKRWSNATVVAPLGKAPWGAVTAAALSGAGTGKFKKPSATPVELIKAKKDFKVELLYTVPRATQGSWVSLCSDDKGRLIASDQYGKLYRITPPAIGGKAEDTKVEEIPVDLGEAQGLLWAFDSLYVVVNRGKKYDSGLWRVWSSKKNDVLDTKEKLRGIDGNGEHGPHAVVLSPDGKSLIVACGNHTKLPKLSGSLVPQVWGEDFIVPRQWDASGHAVGILAPGGYFCKVDPAGKNWELISVGYRNQYDMAYNPNGELFTYDSDMEWDMNLPWYRATRVTHVVDGSEFGWRSGTSNFPAYYPDNLPPAADIGPGSPTGVVFGTGAKFPAKYQKAFFACDWSYGKLYAVHLKPDGSSYTGDFEEFITGSPLPLTDIVVHKDGAMYFTIGGRNALSGLYRVTYTGTEDTSPATPDNTGAEQRATRKKLEAFYGKKDAAAVAQAWPFLKSQDRFLRYAARTVLEFQDPASWQEKALKEADATARTHALIGLIRAGNKALLPQVLESLDGIDYSKLDAVGKIDYLRALQLAFIRLGAPDAAWKDKIGKRLEAVYPADRADVNSELVKLLAYLETPGVVSKTLGLMTKAPSQEEQIDYAFALRTVKSGWTPKEREQYFNWFHKAATYRGGNSFHGFLSNIRKDAIKELDPAEKTALAGVLAVEPTPKSPKFDSKPRPFVKKWEVEELVGAVEKDLTGRDFEKGRNLFGETKCFVCHRFAGEGGGTGPDLTGLIGRFGPRDLLESIIQPSKTISDQYQAVVVNLLDGRQVMGRIVNLSGDGIMVNVDMLDNNKLVTVNRNNIDTIEPSKVSMMPEGSLDTLTRDEILDLVAYLYSRGDRGHAMFRKKE